MIKLNLKIFFRKQIIHKIIQNKFEEYDNKIEEIKGSLMSQRVIYKSTIRNSKMNKKYEYCLEASAIILIEHCRAEKMKS